MLTWRPGARPGTSAWGTGGGHSSVLMAPSLTSRFLPVFGGLTSTVSRLRGCTGSMRVFMRVRGVGDMGERVVEVLEGVVVVDQD